VSWDKFSEIHIFEIGGKRSYSHNGVRMRRRAGLGFA
jgi:hypothetical protein